MQPHATRQDFEIALSGLEYPVSVDALVRHARDHGGVDTEVEAVVAQLPDRPYESAEDLTAALRAVYLQQGVPEESVPL